MICLDSLWSVRYKLPPSGANSSQFLTICGCSKPKWFKIYVVSLFASPAHTGVAGVPICVNKLAKEIAEQIESVSGLL